MTNHRIYSTFASAILTVTMNWFHRGIGIISIAILARVLLPEDFGIIAMASLVVALADVLLNFGVHVPLIQNQNATQAHYDSAWTLRLFQTSISTIAIFVLAPVAADYFGDARVEIVLRFLSFSLLLGGLENIGVVNFQKNMQFGAEFRFRLTKRICGFTATVLLAIILRSYWALVIGMLIERVAGVALSYWLHPMRAKIGFVKMREIFGVSQWMLVYSIGRFLGQKLPNILVGRWSTAATMGAYTVAGDMSAIPTQALLSPVNRALFPAFAKVRESSSRLKEIFLLAQGVQTLIAVPAAAGLALVAEEAVHLLLGAGWQQAVPFVQILALINIAQALTASGMYVLLVLNRIRLNALFVWMQVILFGVIAMSPLIQRDALDVAQLSLLVSVSALWLQFWFLTTSLNDLKMREILAVSIRPLLSVVIMAAILFAMDRQISLPPLSALLLKVLIGVVAYVFLTFVFWKLVGKPAGAEQYVLSKIREGQVSVLKWSKKRRSTR